MKMTAGSRFVGKKGGMARFTGKMGGKAGSDNPIANPLIRAYSIVLLTTCIWVSNN